MEINLTDLECTRVSEVAFKCVAEHPSMPWWFYPIVIACFILAVAITIMTAYGLFGKRSAKEQNRRAEDQVPFHVMFDHRKVE